MSQSMTEPIIAHLNYHLPFNSRSVQKFSDAAVFLDRDGVIVEDVGYIGKPEKLKILPGVPEAIKLLQQRFRIIVVTNQSGIGRCLFSENNLLNVHSELVRILSGQGAILDGIYYCPHIPGAPVEDYNRICDCRKPRPGMLIRAAREWNIDMSNSYMVGDRESDMEAAKAAGVTGIIIPQGERADSGISLKTASLADAAYWMLANDD